jgi:hypothetical protein
VNEVIELHDSKLDAVTVTDGTAVLSLRPAYIHRSIARPAIDAGSGWTQDATITITEASLSASVMLPAIVFEGEVRIGDEILRNIIPTRARFQGAVAIELFLSPAQTLVVRGSSLAIDVQGEPSYVEKFNP